MPSHTYIAIAVRIMPNLMLQSPLKCEWLTLLFGRNGGVVLELVEGPLQHVLRVDLFHSQQVQNHVVGQVEGTVQGIRLTLHII